MFSRTKLFAFVLSSLSIHAVAQDLPKVTFETKAVSVQRAIKELSGSCKIPMMAAANLNEVLVISVKDRPLEEVMQKIARVCSAEWIKDSSGYVLQPAVAIRNGEYSHEREKVLALLKDQLAKRRDQRDKAAKEAQSNGNEPPTPDELASYMGNQVATLLDQADLTPIADLPDDGRLVYSTSPNQLQHPITIPATYIAHLIKSNNDAVAAEKEAEGTRSEEERKAAEMIANFGFGGGKKKRIDATPAKADLCIERAGGMMAVMGRSYQVTLKVYDAKGTLLLSEPDYLSLEPGEMRFGPGPVAVAAQDAGQKKPDKPDAPKQRPIPFSPIAKEIAKLQGGSMMGTSPPKLSPEAKSQLLRPDINDPLSYVPSEAILAIAKDKSLNVVANIPDAVIDAFGSSTDAVTYESYLVDLTKREAIAQEIKDGWLTIMPASPVHSRRVRVDRGALASLIQVCQGKEAPALDDLAAYALRSNPPAENSISMPYLALFVPGIMMNVMLNSGWELLQLYGTFDPPMKDLAHRGGRINYSQLSQAQLGIVNQLVYGAGVRLNVDTGAKSESLGGFFDMVFSMMPQSQNDYREEPTELLPNGLPMNGFLDVKVAASFVGKPVGASSPELTMFGAMGPEELAFFQFMMEQPNIGNAGGEMPKLDQLKLGDRTTMNFIFNLTPVVSTKGMLHDDRLASDGKTVAFNNLPADLKAQIDAAKEKVKKSPFAAMLTMGAAFGGREQQPPPR